MKKNVTIYDIAKHANTSAATVSRVLSQSSYPVSQELRRKIQQAAEELHYIPNMLGRQLKTNNSMTVGVIVPSITNPFYSSIVLGIEEVARKNGYHVLLCNSYRSPLLEEEYLKTLFEKQVRGLIISSISLNQKMLNELLKKGVNLVTLDQSVAGVKSSQIHFDYKKGGYLGTKFLLEKGHRKIAYISAPLNRPSRKLIYQGFLEAMEEYKLVPNPDWVKIAKNEEECPNRNYEFNVGEELTKKILKQTERPTAIFAHNDMTAIGVIRELALQRIKIPDEISVMGFDNIEFSQMVTPSLTTIQQPDYEMGRMACNMLFDQLNGEREDHVEIVLQPKLIERDSVTLVN